RKAGMSEVLRPPFNEATRSSWSRQEVLDALTSRPGRHEGSAIGSADSLRTFVKKRRRAAIHFSSSGTRLHTDGGFRMLELQLNPSRSLAGYIIVMHESDFSEATTLRWSATPASLAPIRARAARLGD